MNIIIVANPESLRMRTVQETRKAKLPSECTVPSLCNVDDHKLCMLTKIRSAFSVPYLRICNVCIVRLLSKRLDIALKATVGLNVHNRGLSVHVAIGSTYIQCHAYSPTEQEI